MEPFHLAADLSAALKQTARLLSEVGSIGDALRIRPGALNIMHRALALYYRILIIRVICIAALGEVEPNLSNRLVGIESALPNTVTSSSNKGDESQEDQSNEDKDSV
jgi:hypothetical protein